MTMEQHTPGPWEAVPVIPDGLFIKREGTWEVRTASYDVCANVYSGGPIRSEADARLIAAAPALLAALQRAVPYLRSHVSITCGDEWSGVGDRLAYDDAEAAIALATGEAVSR